MATKLDPKKKKLLTYASLGLLAVVVVYLVIKRGQGGGTTAGQPDANTLGQYAALFRGNGAGGAGFLSPASPGSTPEDNVPPLAMPGGVDPGNMTSRVFAQQPNSPTYTSDNSGQHLVGSIIYDASGAPIGGTHGIPGFGGTGAHGNGQALVPLGPANFGSGAPVGGQAAIATIRSKIATAPVTRSVPVPAHA